MKKYMLVAAISFISTVTGMEMPSINPENSLNVWEFFSTPNNFDRAIAGSPLWDQNDYNNNLFITALANLHILKNSDLETDNLVILDANCGWGHTSAYLAQNAKKVWASDKKLQNIAYATKKYINNGKSLTFIPLNYVKENFYDLVVSCVSPSSMNELQTIYRALKPHGKFFCILTTQENNLPLEMKVLQEMLPKIKNHIPFSQQYKLENYKNEIENPFPTLESIKNMAQTPGFTIVSCKNQPFNILIKNKQNKQNFITFHQSLIMNLLPMDLIASEKKQAKLLSSCVGKIISKMEKDTDNNWIYPIDKTVLLLQKNI